jgi:hypothetical protein
MGGWAPSSQAQLIRVCDIIVLYIMGFYVITSLIKERIIMIKQLTEVSLKSLDMINKNAEGLNKLAEFLNQMQENQNLMAVKILKLEKILARYQMTEGADERPKN